MSICGLKPITTDLAASLLHSCQHDQTNIIHRFLTRNIYNLHQDLPVLIDAIRSKRAIYIYTGRGPSSLHLHLGHLLPFLLAKSLFTNIPASHAYIQLSDDEKYARDVGLTWAEVDAFATQNAADIQRIGFAAENVHRNTLSIARLYPTVLAISRMLHTDKVRKVLGAASTETVARLAFPAVQMAPCFPEAIGMPRGALCVIPCATDQYPFFRLARDLCERMARDKPVLLCSSGYLLGVKGGKMSGSDGKSAIFLGDSADVVGEKVRSAVSGGRARSEMQRTLGACDLASDFAFQIHRHFEPDDAKYHSAKHKYQTGEHLSRDMKVEAARIISSLLENLRSSAVHNVVDLHDH